MWFMLPTGHLSVVEHNEDSTILVVRARHRRVLQLVREGCGKQRCSGIIHMKEADYPYRVFVKKDIFAAWVAHRVKTIDYPKFKPAAITTDLHDLYVKVWGVIYDHYHQKARGA